MGNRQIDLVVTDLDGTLWDGLGRAHPATLAALGHLSATGMPVLAATARRPASALATMRENGILLPCVLFDGSLGRDFVEQTTFEYRVFDQPSAAAVLEAFVAAGLEPSLNIDHHRDDFVIGERPSTHPGHLKFNAHRTQHADLRRAVHTMPIFTFLLIGLERHRLEPILEAVRPVAEGSVTPDLLYGGYSLSVRPVGVNKWSGVLAFCAARDLDPSRVLAVGDGENDVEVLAHASVSCVPSDGCDAALALATHHIEPARLGGWASVVHFID